MLPIAEELRKVLLPADLAEAEFRSKPAAAVLVLLRPAGEGVEVLLGQRIRREGDPWSGQISFPGGHHQPEDGSLLQTAFRETREEVNLDLEGHADVLGHMAPRSPRGLGDILVVPFVALTAERVEPRPGPEMEETFWAPLAELPASWGETTVVIPIGELRVPAYRWKGRVIWGFTYRVLKELLVLVGVGP